MADLTNVLKEIEALTRQAAAAQADPTFRSHAALLTQTTALSIHAGRAALGASDDVGRYLLRGLYDDTVGARRSLRKKLDNGGPSPAPGKAA